MHIRIVLLRFALGLLSVALSPPASGQKQSPIPPAQDPFEAEWRLNLSKSRLASNDRILNEVRKYARVGRAVRVEWIQNLDGKTPHGSYTAECDGQSKKLDGGETIRCWYASRTVVEGEVRDPRDPKHVYYRREVSADSKTMTLTWFTDAARLRVWTVHVYDRAPE